MSVRLASSAWVRALFQQAGTPHVLHYLDAQFAEITRHFVPPSAAEGFHVVRVAA